VLHLQHRIVDLKFVSSLGLLGVRFRRLSGSAIGPGKPGPPLGIRGVFYRLLAARQLEAGDSRVPWPAVGGSPRR